MRLFFQEAGEGYPLVILHGLLGSSDNWHTLSRRFAVKFKVFSLDLRNHGHSPHSEIFNFGAMADDLLEFFEAHGLHTALILGHSMGGKTAMRFALDHPDCVQRLVIADIAPADYQGRHDHILDALVNLDLRTFSERKEIDAALHHAIPSTATRQFLLKNLRRDKGDTFAWKMNLDVIAKNYHEMNKAIDSETPFLKPTLFLRSTTSGYIGNKDFPMMKRLFPNLVVSDLDVGHWIHAEDPEEFARIVLDFLKDAA